MSARSFALLMVCVVAACGGEAAHDETAAGRTAWTIPPFGEDVAAVVKKLGLERRSHWPLQWRRRDRGVRRAQLRPRDPCSPGTLKLPVVAINAGNSPTDTASLQRHGVDVVVMPGVGHFLMMEGGSMESTRR